MALMELQVAARTDPALSRLFHRLYAEHRQSHDDIWIDAMVAECYARARVKAFLRSTQYLLRRMALPAVWHVPDADFRTALRQWREQAPQFLRGSAVPARARSRA